MSKQTVTGVAEGHLLHKDFLVEYDPDERTWTVEREVPAEPTPEPGTFGSAMVIRDDDPEPTQRHGFTANQGTFVYSTPAGGYRVSIAGRWTDFVPDDQGKYRALLATVPNRAEYAGKIGDQARALADVGAFVTEIDTDILHDGSYAEILRAEFRALGAAYDGATDRAIVAERDARAEHAEVERLRAALDVANLDLSACQDDYDAAYRAAEPDLDVDDRTETLTAVVERLYAQVSSLGAYDEAAPEHRPARVSTPAVTTPGTETPAETPAPAAFVLPEREAVEALLRNYSTTVTRNRAPGDFGAVAHYADQIHALLAEHAVTEERLRDAVTRVHRESGNLMTGEYERRILAHLTGEAS